MSLNFLRKPSVDITRQSSISNTVRSDPRNIGDKTFIGSNIRVLVEFLTNNGYDQQLQPKILVKPSNKDFTNIVMFLFRKLDPNYKETGKFDDEFITIMKYLQYPFAISKQNIAAVGAPHSWPSMLACIMWLVELCQYNESAKIGEENDEDDDIDLNDPSSSTAGFYKYLGKAYCAFLAGKDDLYAQLEEQFCASFENSNVLVRDEYENIVKRNAALAAEIEEVKARSAYLPELDTKRREMKTGHTKMQSLVEELQRTHEGLKAKVAARKIELDKLQESIREMSGLNADLRVKINNQELSPTDVQNMLNEKTRLEDAHTQASDTRQTLQKRIWELEMALREKVGAVEVDVQKYHSIAGDLKLVPQSARNARGENLSIDIDLQAKKREQFLKTEVRVTILPVLQDLRTELCETTLKKRDDLLKEQDIVEEDHVKAADLRDQIEACEVKIRRVEAVYKREKEAHDQGMAVNRSELETLEQRLLSMRDNTAEEARITHCTRRLTETASIRNARRVEHGRKKGAMIESIMDVVTQCAGHRENVQSKLEALKERYSSRLEGLLSSAPATTLTSDAYRTISKQILRAPVTSEQSSLRHHLGGNGSAESTRAAQRNEEAALTRYGEDLASLQAGDDSFNVGSESDQYSAGKGPFSQSRNDQQRELFSGGRGGTGLLYSQDDEMVSPITSERPVHRNMVHSAVSVHHHTTVFNLFILYFIRINFAPPVTICCFTNRTCWTTR
jgi:kinetochore protein NDC80